MSLLPFLLFCPLALIMFDRNLTTYICPYSLPRYCRPSPSFPLCSFLPVAAPNTSLYLRLPTALRIAALAPYVHRRPPPMYETLYHRP
ncbi:hypothetical protein BD626DRAFT_498473 [Schizophyllum amplum]|uniref:Secreted protein n=1 Tax=Schizophyllum amplum TaxID=97359 RepID=A0A550CBM7_9AGAR|nr:hypothetical protein BD626DRAFT_498473 [Auriculariopsis ampla]